MSDDTRTYASTPARSAYHDRLPIGTSVSAQPLLESPRFGFEGDVRMRPLEPMLVPEPPREGEQDATDCFHCTTGAREAIWRDDAWQVGHPTRAGLPFVAGLAPIAHVRLDELDAAQLSTFGDIVQRLAAAVQRIDGVARTHFSRWGDGSAHFHLHFLARPAGMMQGRGPMLAFWDDVLPPIDDEMLAANARTVASALAEGGGESLVA
ncbi:hypothetical protein [Solicola gregarius]|uniref:HIT domain-containing protein n=1 Tax=Solicola gregarius TaxID=2908642 RepID=A0AA46TFJ1_9ACTN|nr:hypothetical protein [Solicola gregarius]UYM04404.1 hypothetical protein L0C25_17965 [Solicola gregarius]